MGSQIGPGERNTRRNSPTGTIVMPPKGGSAACTSIRSDLRVTGRAASASREVMSPASTPASARRQ